MTSAKVFGIVKRKKTNKNKGKPDLVIEIEVQTKSWIS